MSNRNYVSLGDAINLFLEKNGLKEEVKIQQVITQWERIMGKALAEQTEKIWFERGILYLKIASPVWRNELNLAKKEIAKVVNEEIGELMVQDVKVFA